MTIMYLRTVLQSASAYCLLTSLLYLHPAASIGTQDTIRHRRSVENPADNQPMDRSSGADEPIGPLPSIPPPDITHRWFPLHDSPPSDGYDVAYDEGFREYGGVIEPEEITEEILPQSPNNEIPEDTQNYDPKSSPHLEAELLDDFATYMEGEGQPFDPALYAPERKPTRVRRDVKESEFEWLPWEECSVTCGNGGTQTRRKRCFPLKAKSCEEEFEERPCGSMRGCPQWNKWGKWSTCSKTCGEGGVSHRVRRCIMKRYTNAGTPKNVFAKSPFEEYRSISRNKDTGKSRDKVFRDSLDLREKIKSDSQFEKDYIKENVHSDLCEKGRGKETRKCSVPNSCPSSRVRRNAQSTERGNGNKYQTTRTQQHTSGKKATKRAKTRQQSSGSQPKRRKNEWKKNTKWNNRNRNNNNNNNNNIIQNNNNRNNNNNNNNQRSAGQNNRKSMGQLARPRQQQQTTTTHRSGGARKGPTRMVVRPILSVSRQIKMKSKIITKPMLTQQRGPQLRNFWGSYHRFSFSKWGSWLTCNSPMCGQDGIQMRTRSCFGYNFTEEDYKVCSYKNLVTHRDCVAPPCPTTKMITPTEPDSKIISRWSQWSKCSITCGEGGLQTRSRQCFANLPDNIEEVVEMECVGKTLEERPCQYSVGCPSWNRWSAWSSCSVTCEGNGVSFRERKCVVERFVSFHNQNQGPPPEEYPMEEVPDVNNTRMFDAKSVPIKHAQEATNENKKSAVKGAAKHDTKYLPTRKPAQGEMGYVYVTPDFREIYIVDAPHPQQDEVANLHPVKEIVESELCGSDEESSEEEKICQVKVSCPPRWENWGRWSACSRTCRTGISRRQRKCTGGNAMLTCEGRAFEYRRCYSPPCWGEWSSFSDCSVTCGPSAGYQSRTRKCKTEMAAAQLGPEYRSCEGPSKQSQMCKTEQCPGSMWSTWSKYGECTKSCNGGFRQRTRECIGGDCIGTGEDFGRCNIQECPSWTKWSLYSCCSVSCGRGTRKRTRTCNGYDIGVDGCKGKIEDFEYCYRKPCNQTVPPPVFDPTTCGIGSVSNLKRIAQLRIFGGKKSLSHDWPWQVSWQHRAGLDEDWQHFCGATLIHARWVITASHCTEESEYVVNHKNPGDMWSVVVGMDKLYRDGKRHYVERIFVHPEYEYKSVTKNDIALLKLRRMVRMTKQIMPACVYKAVKPSPGDECFITGWGYTSAQEEATLSLSLREASIPIMRFNDCRNLGQYYRYFLNRTIHMCAGNPVTASSDSCTGDSGGPLICSRNKKWYLAAVTSFGFADCGTPGHVGIYAPMATFEPWVHKKIRDFTYERC